MSDRFSHGYALLIGVGECAYPAWSLPVAARDVQALAAALATSDLRAYPEAHIRTLRNAEATRQAILDGLEWLATQSTADPEATAVVYYSGHGWLEKGSGRYYLVPHDVGQIGNLSYLDLAGSALAAETFTAALRKVRARRLLVFLDCCHAGGMATDKGGAQGATPLPPGLTTTAPPKGVTETLKQGAGRVVFSSSTGRQSSYVRPEGSLSLYTYHLLEALQGAANRPGETVVRISHLMNHLGKAVPESARSRGWNRPPSLMRRRRILRWRCCAGARGCRRPTGRRRSRRRLTVSSARCRPLASAAWRWEETCGIASLSPATGTWWNDKIAGQLLLSQKP